MVKFRSWHKYYKEFIYFEDGTIDSLSDDDFSWQNAEQETTRNGVTFFVGDKFKINNAVYGIAIIRNGILGFDKFQYGSDFYTGFSKITNYNIQDMEKLGNIHEVKDVI